MAKRSLRKVRHVVKNHSFRELVNFGQEKEVHLTDDDIEVVEDVSENSHVHGESCNH